MVMYLLDWAQPLSARELQLHENIATFSDTEVNLHNLQAFFKCI